MQEGHIDAEWESPLVRDARALMRQAVRALTDAKTHQERSMRVLRVSRERLVWTDSLIGESRMLRDRLRDAVSGIAGLQRAKGVPPEQVLKLLKSLVLDADAEHLEAQEAQSLTDDIVRWGIEAYYAA
jgi:hypothetical protein